MEECLGVVVTDLSVSQAGVPFTAAKPLPT